MPNQRPKRQRKNKKIVYVDMDGVIADFDKNLPEFDYGRLSDEEWDLFLDKDQYFTKLEQVEGAADALRWLKKYFRVYILSTAPWNAPNSWTEKRLWIGKHFPAFKKKLILSHNKHLCIGDYLIDDRTKNGAGRFKGKHIQFGKGRFSNWPSVIAYLKKIEGIA